MIGVALRGVAVAARNLFRSAALNLDFTKTQALDPRITFTRASTATRINASGVLESVAINGPRFDYDPVTLAPRGLLIEEQRTNSIRNNTMQGAVAGTPGTLPTNWTMLSATSGVSREIVGTGSENGCAYIDVRYSGTTTAAVSGAIVASSETTTGVPAVAGQTWTGSWFVRLIGGSTDGLGSLTIQISERDGSGTLSGAASVSISSVNAAPLNSQRYALTRTLTGATTAFVQSDIRMTVPIATTIDITLRIGMPQLELGAFATSVIPTSGAAATRAADVAVVTGANFSNWYNATTGAVFVDYATMQQTGFPSIVSASDGGNTNRIQLSHASAGRRSVVTAGGVSQWDTQGGVLGTTTSGVFAKFAMAYEASNYAAVVNGGTPATQASGNVPSGLNRLAVGADGASGNFINGHIRKIAYFPRRLSNAELQGITQ